MSNATLRLPNSKEIYIFAKQKHNNDNTSFKSMANEMTNVNSCFINDIKSLVNKARNQAYAAVNQATIEAYWNIGKRIVEEEQHVKERADYGKQLLKQLGISCMKSVIA